MKIIKSGKVPAPPKAWWEDTIVDCPKCKATFQLQKQDLGSYVVAVAHRMLGESPQIKIYCATAGCGQSFDKWKPAIPVKLASPPKIICKGCSGKGRAAHTCPYRVELNNDSVTKCNCCTSCTSDCSMEI